MSEAENERNRRKRERLNLSLPIRVKYRESASEMWEEVTRLIDVTPFGAGFVLARPIVVGRLVQLAIPMPRQLRCYDHLEQEYRIWGLVRHVRPFAARKSATSSNSIGVAFIGKTPPIGYTENPAQLYEVMEPDELGFWRLREVDNLKSKILSNSKTAIPNLRRQMRHQAALNVVIEVFNERGEIIASEMTLTEDVSVTGASVSTTLEIDCGALIRLTLEQLDLILIASVRARKNGKDGIARLHLEFIDCQFPLELVI